MTERVVWKFPLSLDPLAVSFTQVVNVPEAARFLTCAAQGNAIALWYEVDASAKTEQRRFQIFGTGHGPIRGGLVYLGTAIFANGALVLHVYEVFD